MTVTQRRCDQLDHVMPLGIDLALVSFHKTLPAEARLKANAMPFARFTIPLCGHALHTGKGLHANQLLVSGSCTLTNLKSNFLEPLVNAAACLKQIKARAGKPSAMVLTTGALLGG